MHNTTGSWNRCSNGDRNADASAARIRNLEETGKYCLVIADGGMRTGGDIAKAIACGADLVDWCLSRAKKLRVEVITGNGNISS